jgi:hypothetical protein
MLARSKAVEAIAARAHRARDEALERLALSIGESTTAELGRLAGKLVVGRLTLNFHPDRISSSGSSVAAGLLADGRYRSQWVTGLSSGSRSALIGGDRHGWEAGMFDGAYDVADATVERPVYGSLDLLADPHGGSPRFGSGFAVLKSHVLARTTMCIGDSHAGPRDVGTIVEPLALLAGLAEQAAAGSLLGRPMGLDELRAVLDGRLRSDRPGRNLDWYVEAQVHGGVDLASDVESVVLDPSFRGTHVERDLSQAADRYGFRLDWHDGSELAMDAIPPDFRGPSVAELGRRIARTDGLLDAFTIGSAAQGTWPGPALAEGDPPDSDLQQLKYLWHALLAFGHDARPRGL